MTAIVLSFQLTNAQYLLEEDFNFTGNIVGVNDWIRQSGTSNFLQTTPGLSFQDYPGTNIGNAVQINGVGGEDAYKKFTNRTKLYYSFMIKVIQPATSAKIGMVCFLGKTQASTFNGGLNANYFARIAIQTIGNGTWKIGTSNWAIPPTSTPPIFSEKIFNNNQTYAVIVGLDMLNNYKISVWVKDTSFPLTEADAGVPDVTFFNAPNTAALPTSVDAIGLRQDASCPSIVMDGIRIFDNWGPIVLPLKLLSFTGVLQNDKTVSLNLRAVLSYNVSKFEIEKSEDGKIFHYISTVVCINNNDVANYSYQDYEKGIRTIFYRLKIVDMDGKYFYSSVVAVTNNIGSVKIGSLGNRQIKIFCPNTLQIRNIQIIDFSGSILKTIRVESKNWEIQMDLSSLAVGNYILRIEHATSTISQKFILQ